MGFLEFLAVLAVVVTVNVGFALNFVSRRADREQRKLEVAERLYTGNQDRESRRQQFNVSHALAMRNSGNNVSDEQGQLLMTGESR